MSVVNQELCSQCEQTSLDAALRASQWSGGDSEQEDEGKKTVTDGNVYDKEKRRY